MRSHSKTSRKRWRFSARRGLPLRRRDYIGDDLAEWTRILGRPEIVACRFLQRKLREHQFGKAVTFLEMWIAGEDEAVDAKRHIFPHPLRPLIRIADQRRAGSAAHKPDSR